MSNINQLISIIIPVFNESESIGFLLDEVISIMETNKLKSLIQYLPGLLILIYVFFLGVTQFIK